MRLRITVPAALDIDDILVASERNFGALIAQRYETLIGVSIEALSVDPTRTGVRSSPDTAPGVRWLHLRSTRLLVPAPERIGKPRHILVFRTDASTLTLFRVLHDAMDLSAHMP